MQDVDPFETDLLLRVDRIEQLPVLSEHHTRLRQLVKDENSTLGQVAGMVEKDPSFAANLIRLANSPIYGQLREVESVRRAIQVVGFRGVGEMSLVLEVVQGFPFPAALEKALFWDHALNVALIAKDLLADNRELSERAYTVGLLHDVGLLVLANYLPQVFAELLDITAEEPYPSIHEACLESHGCTPAHVSVRLMQRWNFGEGLWLPLSLDLSQPISAADDEHARVAQAVRRSHGICERHTRGNIVFDRLHDFSKEPAPEDDERTVIEGVSAAILACC